MQKQEKRIFEGYEIKNWEFTPRFYKIFAAAAAFNLLAILVMGQTNLLTRKGCESPLVSHVCQALDMVYVGSALFNTDSEFVSKDYEKNELENADITYIDVTGQEAPLKYPEGYFALANPNEFAAMQNPDFSMMTSTIDGFPSNPIITNPTDLMSVPQVTPTPNQNAITGNIPTSPFDFGTNPIPATPPSRRSAKIPRVRLPKVPKMKNNSPNELPKLDGDETAENKDKDKEKEDDKKVVSPQPEINSDPVAGIEINKKPFENLGDLINAKLEKKEVDLNKKFSVVLDGTIAADGTLDSKKSKFIKLDGDEQMVLVAREAIEAVGDSHFLEYLKRQGIDRLTFLIEQDDKQIYVKIVSDQKTPEKAATTASGLNTILSGVKAGNAMGITKLNDSSKALVENSKVTSEGKNFVFNFALPKADAQVLIDRSLKERAQKKANQQPNSTAQNADTNQKTGK